MTKPTNRRSIWVRPDQHELVLDALAFYRNRLTDEDRMTEPAQKIAGRFVIRRIDELVKQIGGEAK